MRDGDDKTEVPGKILQNILDELQNLSNQIGALLWPPSPEEDSGPALIGAGAGGSPGHPAQAQPIKICFNQAAVSGFFYDEIPF